jgi:hypothetical protein
MQSYPFSLAKLQPTQTLSADGDLFVFESSQIKTRTNLLRFSEGTVAQMYTASQTLDTTMKGFLGAIAFGDNSVVRTAYKAITAATLTAAKTHTLSVFVEMLDGGVPVPSKDTISGDFCLVFENNIATPPTPITVDAVPDYPGRYRVSVEQLAAATGNLFGVVKYTNQSARKFNVTGYMLEVGQLTPYIKNLTSGDFDDATGDSRIRVKAENGSEIVLKPGQRVRMTERAQRWYVSSFDGATPMTVNAIIGSGEFDDANTLNTFKLDGTFSNTVTVANATTAPVPTTLQGTGNVAVPAGVKITNDTTARVPISLDPNQTLNISGSTVIYTNSYADQNSASIAAQQVFSAAQNPNGAYIEFAEISMAAGKDAGSTVNTGSVALIAKATAPATAVDGDVLLIATVGGMLNTGSGTNAIAYSQVNEKLPVRVKIAAGKGLYINQAGTDFHTCKKTVLYTLM